MSCDGRSWRSHARSCSLFTFERLLPASYESNSAGNLLCSNTAWSGIGLLPRWLDRTVSWMALGILSAWLSRPADCCSGSLSKRASTGPDRVGPAPTEQQRLEDAFQIRTAQIS